MNGLSARALHAMNLVGMALVLALTPVSAQANERLPLGTFEIDGKKVVPFDDGFWRYDTPAVECHDIPQVGRLCAAPSDWSVFPARQTDIYKNRTQFVSGNTFWGQANALVPIIETQPLTPEDAEAFIRNRVFLRNGLRPNTLVSKLIEIDGKQWQQLVFEGSGVVKAFSLTKLNNRYVIAETHKSRTTLYASEHQRKHADFIASLEISADE